MLPAVPQIFFPVAILFVAFHAVAVRTNLYWYWPSLDIPMHALGGFLTIYGLFMLGRLGSRRLMVPSWLMVVGLLGLMIAWEVFEYFYVIDFSQPHLVRDTIFDFIYGSLGGIVGYLVVKK